VDEDLQQIRHRPENHAEVWRDGMVLAFLGAGPRLGGAMKLEDFAKQHRLRVTKDACGDAVIAGRMYESNIYEWSLDGSKFGVMFITDGKKAPRTGLFKRFKVACLAVGMKPIEIGDAEGAFIFDSMNKEQAKVAIKGIRARVRRQLTPEQHSRLANVGFKARNAQNLAFSPTVEAIPRA
jgi:hypothetical protein